MSEKFVSQKTCNYDRTSVEHAVHRFAQKKDVKE